MLDDNTVQDYATTIKRIKLDIESQKTGLKFSSGDIAECYKKVILDKLWKLSRVVGEHYLACLKEIAEEEATMSDTSLLQTQTALEQMTMVVEQCRSPSSNPSVEEESVPFA